MHKTSKKVFDYCKVFDAGDNNQSLFQQIIEPNFEFIFKGNNFSVFMYG